MNIDEISLVDLLKEAHEAKLLKQYLREVMNRYGDISHEELIHICAMFGVREEGDAE